MSKRFAPLAGLESVDEDRLERALQSFFGFDSFRERQREVCLHVLSPGSRTVCLFPTGAGKSLLFQLSGVVLGGVSLVVSPLVALMQDQVRALQRLCAKSGGQIMADFYSASSSEEEKSRIKSALFNAAASSILPAGKSYIVYVTPEFLLRNPALVNKLVAEKALSLIAIDEAHCVIEFGTDFRPDYLKLGQFMGIPSVRYMALTASVSEETMRQMLASLRMQDARVFKSSFNRPNIFYEVHYADVLGSGDVFDLQKHDMVEWIQAPERAGKSGIVYVRKKTECEEVARFLSEKGVKAEAYHADVKDKSNVQKRWMDNVTQVVVASTAFGMGIDKADVRFVVNYSIPQSMADFYQTSGRAGRDGLPSFSLAYTSSEENRAIRYLVTIPDKNLMREDDASESTQQERVSAKIGQLGVVLDYLHSAKCRRACILAYFGEVIDAKKQCNKSCDFCRNPRQVQRLVNQFGAGEVDRVMGGGRGGKGKRELSNFYPKEDDHEKVTNESNTGSSFKSSREVLQAQMEDRITKRLKQDSVGGGGSFEFAFAAPIAAAEPPKTIEQKVREKSVSFLEKAIGENVAHFQRPTEEVAKWAVLEEQRVFQKCKTSPAAYKARIIALGGAVRQKKEEYKYVKTQKKVNE